MTTAKATKSIRCDKIEVCVQTRYRVDHSVVDEYASDMKAGAVFPAIIVFAEKGSERIILGDGEHRLLATQLNGKKTINCEVRVGDKAKALRYSLGANDKHGLRRTQADKRKAVLMAMNEPEYEDWSLRALSELCHVSHELVRQIKQEINEKAKALDDEDSGKSKKKKKVPETQEEVDLGCLREAITAINGLPYSGEEAFNKLPLEESDMKKMVLARDWLTELLE